MHPILQEYQDKIEEITGMMVRLCGSLYAQRENLNKLAETARVPLSTTLTECSYSSDDKEPIHTDTLKNHLFKLENYGFDETTLGNMAIVYIYALWEDKYRKDYAAALGCTNKNMIKSEIFAELNKYRRVIVHNRSRGNIETEKLQILPRVNEGSSLNIDRHKFELIIKIIKKELSCI